MKVLLATPAYGGNVTSTYMMSVLNAVNWGARFDIEIQTFLHSGESLITRARNDIVALFLEGDWEKLLWVDADIGFDVNQLQRVLSSPYEVTAGIYPLKRINWAGMAAATEGDPHGGPGGTELDVLGLKTAATTAVAHFMPDTATDDRGYREMLDVGTGFLAIDRWVLEMMVDEYADLRYTSDSAAVGGDRWALFDTMIEDGRYLSEDYAFCRRWQKLGGKVWADVESPVLRHQGLHTFGE